MHSEGEKMSPNRIVAQPALPEFLKFESKTIWAQLDWVTS